MTDTSKKTTMSVIKDIFHIVMFVIFISAIVAGIVLSPFEKIIPECDMANTAYSAAYVDYESTLRKAQNMLTSSDSQHVDTKTRKTLTNLTETKLEKTPDVECGLLVTADAVDNRNAQTRDVEKATIRLKEALLNAENTTDK